MKLLNALRADRGLRLAVVGSGGKTSAMFALARQMTSPVILSATAHLNIEQTRLADVHVVCENPQDIRNAFKGERWWKNLLITGPVVDRGRTSGLTDPVMDQVFREAEKLHLPVIIEADGARRLPLKAPAAHEPPIPAEVNHVLVVAGLSGLGKPLNEDHVFRAEIFATLSGIKLGEPVSLELLARYLMHPEGGLKNIPPSAAKSVLFNQTDQVKGNLESEEAVAQNLLQTYQRVLFGQMRVEGQLVGRIDQRIEKIAGIILAAGESNRFGMPKQLLDWKGKPFVRHIAECALTAGLDPVVIVAGSMLDPIREALNGVPAAIVENRHWRSGQSTSIQAGLTAMPVSVGGAIFFMADMPQVPLGVIKSLIEIHRREDVDIVVPRVNGRRANPALFDRKCFEALATIRGDTGGRVLFDKYPIRWLDWDDDRLLMDVDTPEDYDKLIRHG